MKFPRLVLAPSRGDITQPQRAWRRLRGRLVMALGLGLMGSAVWAQGVSPACAAAAATPEARMACAYQSDLSFQAKAIDYDGLMDGARNN